MKKVIETSCMDRPEGGWYTGELNGRPAYSDGCAAFVGKVAKEEDSGRKFKLNVEESIFEKRVYGEARIDGTPYVLFSSDYYVRKCYYNEAELRFPSVRYYLRAGYPMLACKAEGKIVGVIMRSTPNYDELDYPMVTKPLPLDETPAA